MAVFDVFPFFNELDLLEIRLHTLDEFVDEFIITEGNLTFSGDPKPYYLSESLERFKKFSNKITVQKVDYFPKEVTPFGRDRFQRDQVSKILNTKLKDSDILIYGDLDEIPNPVALMNGIEKIQNDHAKIVHLAQDVYYCFLNQKEVSKTFLSFTGEYRWIYNRKWLGTNISKWIYSKRFLPTDLRSPIHKKNGLRIKNGGWHFSYIGSEGNLDTEERVRKKISSSSHQEFNEQHVLSSLQFNIANSKDIFSRKRSRFKILDNLDYLPKYILDNLPLYESLIKHS
jgi:beta-1,4-mannosyl-glycoprotein beta-1,4-N-acetylglucosaminyltransferase